jgi:hypothetical protein
MYSDLRLFSPGSTITLGEFKIPLIHFGKAFKDNPLIRKNFKEFTGDHLPTIQAIADHFVDYKIKPEEAMRMIFRGKET